MVLNKIISSVGKIKQMTWRQFYFLFVAFFLVNISYFVQSDKVNVYTSVVVIYTLLVVLFRNSLQSAEKPIFQTIIQDSIFLFIALIVFSIIPDSLFTYVEGITFPSVLVAWLYFIVVGFSETLIYVVALPTKIDIFWSSFAFSVTHLTTILLINPDISYLGLFFAFAIQFLANIFFWIVYLRTGSLFRVAILHAMFDLKKVAMLSILGGLI